MKRPSVWKKKTLRRWIGVGAVTAIWLAVMLGAAVPAWQKARAQHREIQEMEAGLVEMERWAVAGLWLERSVLERAGRVEQEWVRLFPAERKREELFLELAAVADAARVEGFRLQEVQDSRMEEDHLWLDRPDGDITEWMNGPITGVDLGYYRIRASFRADYRRVAAFLGGINGIERALSVHSLDVQPDDQGVKVEMKLDVYLSEKTES